MKKSIIMIGILILFIGTPVFAGATNVKTETDVSIKEPLPIGRNYWPVTMLSGNMEIESYEIKKEVPYYGWIGVNITGIVKEQPYSGHKGFFIGIGWPAPIFHPFAPRIPEGTRINLKMSLLTFSGCTNFTVGEIFQFGWNWGANIHLKYV